MNFVMFIVSAWHGHRVGMYSYLMDEETEALELSQSAMVGEWQNQDVHSV